MSTTTVISTVDNITLVTLQDCPANAVSIAKVFDEISQCGINIDMISMAPTHGATTGLSFTIADEDLIGILGFTSKLKRETDIDVIVSSVNHKISVYDTAMRNTPGIAAQVFNAISGTEDVYKRQRQRRRTGISPPRQHCTHGGCFPGPPKRIPT